MGINENEAKEFLEAFCRDRIEYASRRLVVQERFDYFTNVLTTAIKALNEIQQYRAIGTLDELKELKENASSGLEIDMMTALAEKLGEYIKIGTPDECRAAVEIMKILKSGYPWIAFTCDHCGATFVKAKTIYCPKCREKVSWERDTE